jgi:hypothetical protein
VGHQKPQQLTTLLWLAVVVVAGHHIQVAVAQVDLKQQHHFQYLLAQLTLLLLVVVVRLAQQETKELMEVILYFPQ